MSSRGLVPTSSTASFVAGNHEQRLRSVERRGGNGTRRIGGVWATGVFSGGGNVHANGAQLTLAWTSAAYDTDAFFPTLGAFFTNAVIPADGVYSVAWDVEYTTSWSSDDIVVLTSTVAPVTRYFPIRFSSFKASGVAVVMLPRAAQINLAVYQISGVNRTLQDARMEIHRITD